MLMGPVFWCFLSKASVHLGIRTSSLRWRIFGFTVTPDPFTLKNKSIVTVLSQKLKLIVLIQLKKPYSNRSIRFTQWMEHTCFGKAQDFRNEFPVNPSDVMLARVEYIAYIKSLKNEAGN